MKTTNNTILITGGSAGIGFEIAKLFSEAGNQVIITGRNQQRLDEALAKLPGATGILGDISKKEDTAALVSTLKKDFPNLNIVVNNAGQAYLNSLINNDKLFENAEDEMLTNYLSVIRLNEQLHPLLSQQEAAAIVNVSSIVAIVPGSIATYSASKAALHSYTLALRVKLSDTNIKVFELMPPLVNTDFSKEIGGSAGIHPAEVASDLLNAIKDNIYEIHVGNTQYIYDLYLQSPEEALKALNTIR